MPISRAVTMGEPDNSDFSQLSNLNTDDESLRELAIRILTEQASNRTNVQHIQRELSEFKSSYNQEVTHLQSELREIRDNRELDLAKLETDVSIIKTEVASIKATVRIGRGLLTIGWRYAAPILTAAITGYFVGGVK